MNYQKGVYPDESKCGGCGWKTQTKYAMEGLDIDEQGLCADCFMEMLEEAGAPLRGLKELSQQITADVHS